MKKFSLIVALLIALTVMFISCGTDPTEIEPPKGVTYSEVKLDNGMNIWAGGKDQQQGWATGANFKFKGVGDKIEFAKDAGYKAEDFKAAEFLQFELQPGAPKGGVQIIWGAAEDNDKNISGWNSNRLTTDNGEITAGVGITVTKGEDGKGDTWKIELKKALANFGQYKNADEVKILLQYYTDKGIPSLYVANSAVLLIPDVEVKFQEVTGITLKTSKFYWTGELKLEGTVAPDDATEQLIIWSIKDWTPVNGTSKDKIYVRGDPSKPTQNEKDPADPTGVATLPNTSYNYTKAALLAKVDFKSITKYLTDDEWYTDYSVVPPIEIKNASKQEDPYTGWKSNDTIIAKALDASMGTVTIQALVIGGGKDGADYTQNISVIIEDAKPLPYKIGTTASSTKVYDAIGGKITALDDGFSAKLTGSYNGGFPYFQVDFGTKTFADVKGIKFTYAGIGDVNGTSNDWNSKIIRVYANKTKPTGGYDADYVVGITANSGDITDKSKDFAIDFGKGSYGVWNGASDDMHDLEDAGEFDTTTAAIGTESKIYFRIFPWANPVEYKITGIEFVMK